MAFESPGAFNQNSTYSAEILRRGVYFALQRGSSIGSVVGGIVAATDCQISAGGAMTINVAAGEAVVPGSSAATQSGYYGRVSSTSNLSIAASDPTNPRIDRVSAVITDSAYSGGTNTFAVSVATGTPTSGATLVNLNGVAAAPASSLTLGYVLVPAGSSSVTNGNISNVAALASDAVSTFATTSTGISATAVSGQWIEATAGSITITLPLPVKNSIVAVTAASSSISGSAQVTVAAGSSGAINGLGLSSAASFKLGAPGAHVILVADGSNWQIISGQQDTGWVALTLSTNWTATAGAYAPAARVVGNMVYLRGQTTNGTGSTSTAPFATFATTFRPASKIAFVALTVLSSPLSVTLSSAGVFATIANVANGDTLSVDGLNYSLS